MGTRETSFSYLLNGNTVTPSSNSGSRKNAPIPCQFAFSWNSEVPFTRIETNAHSLTNGASRFQANWRDRCWNPRISPSFSEFNFFSSHATLFSLLFLHFAIIHEPHITKRTNFWFRFKHSSSKPWKAANLRPPLNNHPTGQNPRWIFLTLLALWYYCLLPPSLLSHLPKISNWMGSKRIKQKNEWEKKTGKGDERMYMCP